MNLQLIGVPLWYGCDNPGTEKAFDCFCRAGIQQLAQRCGHQVTHIFPVEVPEDREKYEDPSMEYCTGTIAACRHLEQAVAAAQEAGDFPFVLGGDHSLSIGSLAGVSHTVPARDLTVIWVDAHTDINTDATSGSHHIHGMPLAAAMGRGHRRLIDGFGAADVKLLPENLFYIGIRSVDDPEWETLRELNICCFTMEDVEKMGIDRCVQELLSRVSTPYIHLSFDVDFLDGELFRATGLPVPHGPSIADAHRCLTLLLQSGKVGSMDFVEYSPVNDTDGSGLAACMAFLETCFRHLGST